MGKGFGPLPQAPKTKRKRYKVRGILWRSLCRLCRIKIRRVQTDNGKEFEEHLERLLREMGIVHYYNYPRSAQSNAYVERFNKDIAGALC